MSRSKKSVQEQVQSEYPEFADEVAGLSAEVLVIRLAKNATDAEAVQQAQEDDLELEQAKQHASDLSAPYRDGKKALRLKSRYLIAMIKEKGGE